MKKLVSKLIVSAMMGFFKYTHTVKIFCILPVAVILWSSDSSLSIYRQSSSVHCRDKAIDHCTYENIRLYGKVQFVSSFPDIKIQYVSGFSDIKVKYVNSFPDDCGEWQVVESFPDFKVQVVESFPDLKVQVVQSFPGM